MEDRLGELTACCARLKTRELDLLIGVAVEDLEVPRFFTERSAEICKVAGMLPLGASVEPRRGPVVTFSPHFFARERMT